MDEVERRQVPLRPTVSEAGDRAADDPGVEAGQGLVVEAKPFDDPRPEVVDDDVSSPREVVEYLSSLRALEVEHEASLASVERQEHRTLAAEVGDGRVPPQVTARRLDLDHVGAHIRHQHPGQPSRADLAPP